MSGVCSPLNGAERAVQIAGRGKRLAVLRLHLAFVGIADDGLLQDRDRLIGPPRSAAAPGVAERGGLVGFVVGITRGQYPTAASKSALVTGVAIAPVAMGSISVALEQPAKTAAAASGRMRERKNGGLSGAYAVAERSLTMSAVFPLH